jgi:copper resistance protein B
VDRAEARIGKGRDGWLVDAEAWFGKDIDKAVIKLEGEGPFGGRVEHLSAQALWSHAIGPYFDLQAGVRADFEPKARGRLVLGVEGLAPYWIHVDAATFLSTKGDITAELEAAHDIRITQKWVLQPRVAAEFALQNIPEEGVGRGLSSASAGLRLGYKIEPNFIPYIGVEYDRAFGRTADYRRGEGERAGELRALIGLRGYF